MVPAGVQIVMMPRNMWIKHTVIMSHLNAMLARELGMLGIYVACAMQHCHLWIIVVVLSLFILHHVAACVRPDAAAWTRLSSGGNSSPQTARPVASPAQWSPGSSLDLWCKWYFLFNSICTVTELNNNTLHYYSVTVLEGVWAAPWRCRNGALNKTCNFVLILKSRNRRQCLRRAYVGLLIFDWSSANSTGLYFAISAGMLSWACTV